MRNQLQDTDWMPWGKHGPKGDDVRTMQDVPASYFHWLWTERGFKDNKADPVADYIRRNLDALKQENDDLIWD